MTRPGVLLVGVLSGLWLAAFYSGNNLLYLCGAMLSALVFASIWQGVRLLKSVPLLNETLPSHTEASEPYLLRTPLKAGAPMIGEVELLWYNDEMSLPLQLRLEENALISGRLKAEQRALIRLEQQRLSTSAPLGLWRISHLRNESGIWPVMPKSIAWMKPGFEGSRRARRYEGDELRDLRGYLPGDMLSRVHWRKSALGMEQWSVKQFEQHDPSEDFHILRVDLRLPQAASESAFEALLGRAWFWVDEHLRRGDQRVEVVLGQDRFDLAQAEQREMFFVALAGAMPQTHPPVGHGGLFLSLMGDSA